MTVAIMRRALNGLMPTDTIGQDALDSIAVGELVKVKLTRPRNLQHHRLFFAALQKVWENQDHFKSVDHLLFALKIRLGYVEEVVMRDGVHLLPTSISFAKMDQTKFREFFDNATNFLCTEVIPGMDKADLMAEVQEMIG